MKVGLKGAEPVIQGVPTGVVDIARCNWQLESDMLVVHLRKTTPGQWTDFIDDCKPEVEGKHHGLGVAQWAGSSGVFHRFCSPRPLHHHIYIFGTLYVYL